jgi:hypothetical protein
LNSSLPEMLMLLHFCACKLQRCQNAVPARNVPHIDPPAPIDESSLVLPVSGKKHGAVAQW